MGLQAEQIADIVSMVKDAEDRGTYTLLTTELQKYPAMRQLFKAKGRRERGGEQLSFNAMVASMATLRPTNELYRTHRQELTDPWVGPGAVRHAEKITELADELIDAFIERGECDFVRDFAWIYPVVIVSRLLGTSANPQSQTSLSIAALVADGWSGALTAAMP